MSSADKIKWKSTMSRDADEHDDMVWIISTTYDDIYDIICTSHGILQNVDSMRQKYGYIQVIHFKKSSLKNSQKLEGCTKTQKEPLVGM